MRRIGLAAFVTALAVILAPGTNPVRADDKKAEDNLRRLQKQTEENLRQLKKAMEEQNAKQKARQAKVDETIKELDEIRKMNRLLEEEAGGLIEEGNKAREGRYFLAPFPFPPESPLAFVTHFGGRLSIVVPGLGTVPVRADEKTEQLQAELERVKKELEELKARNAKLEKALVEQALATEEAKKELLKAQIEAKSARALAEENAKKVEALLTKLKESKVLDKPPPALLANIRGEVTEVKGDQVTLSIGIDAGLAEGSVLDIYRLDGGGRYLGTVKVTNAKNLSPKSAIVTFTPAKNVSLDKLKPEELPRKSDEVRPPAALTRDK